MGYLSIDFRNREIRLLESDGSTKSLKLKKFRILEKVGGDGSLLEDEESTASLSSALGKMLSKDRFSRDPAGIAMGSSYCMFRDLDLPFKNDDQIKKVIKFEVEGSIQTDIEDVVISYFKKSESLDKSHLMVLGAQKDILTSQLAFFENRDVDPYFIDLDLLCIYNALSAAEYLKESDSFLVVNVSTEATQVLAINRGRMVLGRSIPIGVGETLRALKHDLETARIEIQEEVETLLGVSSTRAMTVTLGEDAADEGEDTENGYASKTISPTSKEVQEMAEERRAQFLTKLRREFIRTLTFQNGEEKPQKVFITGSGCTLPGFSDFLKNMFGTKVEELDLLSRVDHTFPEEEAVIINREICIPLGVAYKLTGYDRTRVDFRQEEVKYAKKFDQVKVPLACFVFLLLILVVLLNLEQYMRREAKRWEMMQITKLASESLSIALEDMEKADGIVNRYEWGLNRINGIENAIEGEKRKLNSQLGREGTIPELPSAFPVWHAFFKVFQEHEDDFELFKLTKMDIKMLQKNPTLSFNCIVASGDDESKLETYLNEVPMFTVSKLPISRPTAEGREMKDMQLHIDLSKMEAPRK